MFQLAWFAVVVLSTIMSSQLKPTHNRPAMHTAEKIVSANFLLFILYLYLFIVYPSFSFIYGELFSSPIYFTLEFLLHTIQEYIL